MHAPNDKTAEKIELKTADEAQESATAANEQRPAVPALHISSSQERSTIAVQIPRNALSDIVSWIGMIILRLLPALLDKRTQALLSELGCDDRWHGQAYTAIRVGFVAVIVSQLPVQNAFQLALVLPTAITSWITPNFGLSYLIKYRKYRITNPEKSIKLRVLFAMVSLGAALLLYAGSFVNLLLNLISIRELESLIHKCFSAHALEASALLAQAYWTGILRNMLETNPSASSNSLMFLESFWEMSCASWIALLHLSLNTRLSKMGKAVWAAAIFPGVAFPLPFAAVVYLITQTRLVDRAGSIAMLLSIACVAWVYFDKSMSTTTCVTMLVGLCSFIYACFSAASCGAKNCSLIVPNAKREPF